MGKGANMYFLIWAGIFHSKHVNFVQKLGKLVVTMLTLKNLNIPAEIFSFLTISCSHTYLFVSILQRQRLCLDRHLFECQVFFFSLGRLAWLWLLRVINQPKITWIRSGIRSFKIFICLCQKTFCSGLSAFVCYDYKQNIFGTFRFLESRNLSPCGHSIRHPDSFFNKNPATTFKSKTS